MLQQASKLAGVVFILTLAYHTTRDGERKTEPTHETTWPWTKRIDEQPSRVWARDGVEPSAFYATLGTQGMLAI